MRKVFGKGINFAAQINSSRINVSKFECIQQLSAVPIKNLSCGYLQTYYFLENGQLLKIGHIMDSLLNIRQLNMYRLVPGVLKYIQKLSILGKNLSFKGGHDRPITINPQMLQGEDSPTDVEFGISRVFLRDSSKNTYALGQNYFGQLGTLNNITLEQTFRKIENPKNQRIKSISCGFQHTAFITESGNLYGCGKADSYQIQPMNTKTRKSEVSVSDKILDLSLIWKGQVRHVGCGFKHTIFSLDSNELYGLGNNKYGQAGQNYKEQNEIMKPSKIYFPLKKGEQILDIKCGFNHSLVLTNQELYFFGCTQQNQNPFEKYSENLSSPTRMKLPFKAEKIFTNFDRTGVVGTKGECVIFGGNSLGKLGGHTGDVEELTGQFDWGKDSLIGLGFGHTIIRP